MKSLIAGNHLGVSAWYGPCRWWSGYEKAKGRVAVHWAFPNQREASGLAASSLKISSWTQEMAAPGSAAIFFEAQVFLYHVPLSLRAWMDPPSLP
jgi:hypothetical protein